MHKAPRTSRQIAAGECSCRADRLKGQSRCGNCFLLPSLQVDLHVPAVPDNFERLRSDYMVELHLKVMQHQLDQVGNYLLLTHAITAHVSSTGLVVVRSACK